MELDWPRLGYVALCVVVPAAWGAAMAWMFDRLDARRAARPPERPPIDYTI